MVKKTILKCKNCNNKNFMVEMLNKNTYFTCGKCGKPKGKTLTANLVLD